MTNFELTEEQETKLEAWQEQMATKNPDNFAAGERWTYCFTPTGLGLMLHVIDNITKEEIDLTEWEYW